MGKISAIIGIAALAGLGFYVGKKVIDKRNAEEEERAQHVYEDDSELFVEEKHSSPKEKLQRASMFAVGAIKTGTEKFKEGIDEIINNDMVSKGQETFEQTKTLAGEAKDKAVNFAKSTGENIKTGFDNIKSKVIKKADDVEEAVEETADEAAETAEEAVQEAAETAEEAVNNAEEAAEAVKDEISEAADEIENISVNSESVETFDFSNPEQL